MKNLSTGAPLLQGHTKNELYEWPLPPSPASVFSTSTTNLKSDVFSWHYRLGHPSISILQNILSTSHLPVSGSPIKPLHCSDCLQNKSHKLSFSQSSITSSRPLEYVFSDVWTSPIFSIDKFKYYLIIVDHFTRYTWLYPLHQKSQVRDSFIKFTSLVENRFSFKIGTLFSDNGGEFIALRSFLSTHGISHLTSPPHTPEHNGLAERRHRHIVETGLALLTHSEIPTTNWSYAFATTVFLINRMPTPTLSFHSPYHKLFGQIPNYNKLKLFGSLCFPWLKPYNSHKLQPKSLPCIFLGYSLTQSAYLYLEPKTSRIFVSRHVVFDETKFPFKSLSQPSSISIDTSSTSSSWLPPITIVPQSSSPLIAAPSTSLETPLEPLSSASSPSSDSPDNSTATPPSPIVSVADDSHSVPPTSIASETDVATHDDSSPTIPQQAQLISPPNPAQTETQTYPLRPNQINYNHKTHPHHQFNPK